MRLYFAKADLLLHKNTDGEFVLGMAGKELGKFKQEKKAIGAACNKIRQELEKELPQTQMTDEERRELLRKHLVNSLAGHNSWHEPKKAVAKISVHHS